MRILITGVGGPAGINFAKELSKIKEIKLIGANAEKETIGKKFLQKFYTLPFASKLNFIEELNKIISNEKIDLLIPLVDEELVVVSQHIKNINCKVLISPEETIKFTTDKSKIYEKLEEFLPTRYDKSNPLFPLFVKPNIGRGGRDVHIVYDKYNLNKFDSNQYVFQEILEAPEYTVDTLFDFGGNPLIIVPRIRVKVESGISVTGKIILNKEIISKVKKISKKLKFIGPINFQFMHSKDGLKLMEINARSSGGMGITINSGINIPRLTYELTNRGVKNIPKIKEGEFDNFDEILERQKLKVGRMGNVK